MIESLVTSDCKPYLSATLFQATHTSTAKLAREISDFLSSLSAMRAHVLQDPADADDDLDITCLSVEEKRRPAWFNGDGVENQLHHLVVCAKYRETVAICCTDSSLRIKLLRAIKANTDSLETFADLKQLSAKKIEDAFIEDTVRTLWLSGVHRRTGIKADSKVLAGRQLESALDPLDDQSYFFSSARTTSTNTALSPHTGNAIVGVSPNQSRVWIGPSKNWRDFTNRLLELLRQSATNNGKKIPILARPANDIGCVRNAYDLALTTLEQLSSDEQSPNTEDGALQYFEDAVSFQIEAASSTPNFEADVLIGGNDLGRLQFCFDFGHDTSPCLTINSLNWNDKIDCDGTYLDTCTNAENLTVYFDSGHTYSQDRFYEVQVRDLPFDGWTWLDFGATNTCINLEKPAKKNQDGKFVFAPELVGKPEDNSLFGYVINHWSTALGLDCSSNCWLLCDDGSGEVADFVHFVENPTRPKLTLIHAKGSGSSALSRGISVCDYEVVVSQAIKNLRHLDLDNLHGQLAVRGTSKLHDAVWLNGVRQRDRSQILSVLKSAGSNVELEVAILQPRMLQSKLDFIRAQKKKGKVSIEMQRLRQLDSLLLAAQASCASFGADFRVYAQT